MVLSEITEFFAILIVALLLLMLVVRVLKTHLKKEPEAPTDTPSSAEEGD